MLLSTKVSDNLYIGLNFLEKKLNIYWNSINDNYFDVKKKSNISESPDVFA